MSISEADDCSHEESSKLVLDNTTNDQTAKPKKKERKSVRISEDDITVYPLDDTGYKSSPEDETVQLLNSENEGSKINYIVEEWTEELFGNDNSIKDLQVPSHDTILKNKVTFCDTPQEPPPPAESTTTTEQQTSEVLEVLILDSPPSGHKISKRSPSLESRDNPFMPGGSLDQEASDILKRATIIRDQFILSNEENNSSSERKSEPDRTEIPSDVNQFCDDVNGVTEETILQQSVNSSQALPNTRQNGKVEDKKVSLEPQLTDNSQKDGHLDMSLKDKKKQKKCCILM